MSTPLLIALVVLLVAALGVAIAAVVAAALLLLGTVAAIAGTLASVAGFLVASQVRYQLWARANAAPVLPSRGIVKLHLREALAFATIGWWHLWGHVAARLGAEPGGRPVLAVHGYTQNGTNFQALRRALAAHGRPTRTVFLGFAWPWRRVSGYGLPLVRALERHVHHPDGIDLVAHSMGGVVIRDVLHRHPHLRAVVRSVVTLGSPHGGTAVARQLTWLHPASDLMHRSDWVLALPTLSELLPHARITTVGSAADLIVYPVETTMQPGAAHVGFDDIGHVGLLVDPRSVRATVAALTA